jgi:hypothetical protein
MGVLTGPIVWAALLQTNYSMSYVACEQASKWMLHLATIVALMLVGAAAFAAWRAKPAGVEEDTASTAPERTGRLRARYMAIGGMVLCAWFALAILAFEVPALLLKPCSP